MNTRIVIGTLVTALGINIAAYLLLLGLWLISPIHARSEFTFNPTSHGILILFILSVDVIALGCWIHGD